MQISSAFGRVQSALSFVVNSYTGLASWHAVVDRLRYFGHAMDQVKVTREAYQRVTRRDGSMLRLVSLDVSLPDGRVLIRPIPRSSATPLSSARNSARGAALSFRGLRRRRRAGTRSGASGPARPLRFAGGQSHVVTRPVPRRTTASCVRQGIPTRSGVASHGRGDLRAGRTVGGAPLSTIARPSPAGGHLECRTSLESFGVSRAATDAPRRGRLGREPSIGF
jgi:hypothetical protein